MDKVRVLRIIEYVGSRDRIEKQIERSIHGTREFGNGVTIRVATIGSYPEVLDEPEIGGYVTTKEAQEIALSMMEPPQ